MSRKAAVIGAGISGMLTAIRLRRAGWSVTVIEAKHIGAGSSSRTAAGIRQQFSTKETVLGMRYSVQFYKKFKQNIGGEITPIVQNGYLFLLNRNLDAAMARVEMQRAAGLEDVHFLSPEETCSLFPYVDPDGIQGATWCKSDGFLRPGIIYGESAQAAVREGVVLVQNAPVNKVRLSGARISEVRADRTWIGADLFVDCTNAWSPRLAALLGGSYLPISPVKRYLWFVERGNSMPSDTLANMPMVITPSGAYCRPESRESLMMGWAHPADAEPSFEYEDQDAVEEAFSHDSGIDSRAYEAWESIAETIPTVGEFEGLAATTSGYYGTTPDHNPFLGFDQRRPNLLRLVGFSGHGAMFGPFTSYVGLKLAEEGRNVPSVEILGETASMASFAMDREFKHAEHMVI
jgi:sarcosine oxidase, subunit beta